MNSNTCTVSRDKTPKWQPWRTTTAANMFVCVLSSADLYTLAVSFARTRDHATRFEVSPSAATRKTLHSIRPIRPSRVRVSEVSACRYADPFPWAKQLRARDLCDHPITWIPPVSLLWSNYQRYAIHLVACWLLADHSFQRSYLRTFWEANFFTADILNTRAMR